MKHILKACLFIALGANIHALAGDAATLIKADTLRKEPFADAKTVGSLSKNDSVEIMAKKGAWLQVKSKKSTGWLRLLSVKRGGTSSSGSAISDIASGRTGTGKVVSTTGIRGLSAEELKAAKFNEDEMKQMDSLTLLPKDGQNFANAGGLVSNKMTYLKGAQQ